MKYKLILFYISIILLSFIFSSCNSSEDQNSEYVIGYSTPSLQNPFWISVANAMQEEADELGVQLILRDASNDVAKQASDIEDMIQQGVDILLVTPYDSVSLAPTIKIANEAGIPVIVVDIGINDPDVEYESLIITDNYTGGRLAGEWLVEYIAENDIENPTVATIEAQLGAENARERHRGFVDVMEENGIEVVLGRTANSKRDEAMTVMEDYLQAYPELTAVFAENDDMALGALQAVIQADVDTVIIGYDGIESACQKLAEGTNLMADVGQQPDEMGALAIEMAVDLINGTELEEEVIITPILITKDNIYEFIE